MVLEVPDYIDYWLDALSLNLVVMDPEVFRCPICKDIISDAQEVNCCGQSFCKVCLNGIYGTACPHCREDPFSSQENQTVRRALASTSIKCTLGCEYKGTLADIDAHLKSCPKREYECPADGCNFKSTKSVFAAHIADAHVDALVANAQRILLDEKLTLEKVAIAENEQGWLSRLGHNGKYYCGGERKCQCDYEEKGANSPSTPPTTPSNSGSTPTSPSIVAPTLCSPASAQAVSQSAHNNLCGFYNGCNCQSCMKLDIKSRNLPSGWYVNDDGSPCQRSTLNTLIYCGRRLFQEDSKGRRLDAYCGPRQGPQCKACQVLEEHIESGIYK